MPRVCGNDPTCCADMHAVHGMPCCAGGHQRGAAPPHVVAQGHLGPIRRGEGGLDGQPGALGLLGMPRVGCLHGGQQRRACLIFAADRACHLPAMQLDCLHSLPTGAGGLQAAGARRGRCALLEPHGEGAGRLLRQSRGRLPQLQPPARMASYRRQGPERRRVRMLAPAPSAAERCLRSAAACSPPFL